MEKVKDSVSFLSVMTKSKALLSLFVFIAVMSEARSIVMSKALKILKRLVETPISHQFYNKHSFTSVLAFTNKGGVTKVRE